jgi:cellulose synthase/poly-beta-1,6-N-acetylglucosamine synthase-like glycosyltransferase
MLDLVLFLIVVPVQLPAYSLLLLTLAAKDTTTRMRVLDIDRPSVAIIVPAHNESEHLLPTISCILPQLNPTDILLVVADNCSDDTAQVALRAGATVVERHDSKRRGKGYALDYGLKTLSSNPPEVIMVIDADCTVSEKTLDVMTRAVIAAQQPVQMLNLMHAEPGASLRYRMLEFAMLVKNKVRPIGSQRLGQACHLMGTGMAFPWKVIASLPLATGHIAEDMKLGIETAIRGQPAILNTQVQVSSRFPEHDKDAQTQKTRWEHGHLATMGELLPQLLRAAISQKSWTLFVLLLDFIIPPLTLYTVVLLGVSFLLGLASIWQWQVVGLAVMTMVMACAALSMAVAIAWWQHARFIISFNELLKIPFYALWKMPIYIAYFVGKRVGWVRAHRSSDKKNA